MVKLRNWNPTEKCFLTNYHPIFYGLLDHLSQFSSKISWWFTCTKKPSTRKPVVLTCNPTKKGHALHNKWLKGRV